MARGPIETGEVGLFLPLVTCSELEFGAAMKAW